MKKIKKICGILFLFLVLLSNYSYAKNKSYQPLFLDSKSNVYFIDLKTPAWIWFRLSNDTVESVQAASVVINYRDRTKDNLITSKRYYIAPRLGKMQLLSETINYPSGKKEVVMSRSYDPNAWFTPQKNTPEEKIFEYSLDYPNPKYRNKEMTVVTIDEVRELAARAKKKLWAEAKEKDRDPKLYLHWTAVSYGRFFPSYHVNIDNDGVIYVSAKDFSEATAGTWLRNSGAVNLTLTGCVGANTKTLGNMPPTEAQIDAMAKVIAALADGIGIPIDKNHVLTHGEAANNEDGLKTHNPYAWWNDSYKDNDTRGDLEYLGTHESPSYNPYNESTRGGEVLRRKAREMQER